MIVKAELQCYFCGHDLGEVKIPAPTRRPMAQQLYAAYLASGRAEQPVWDAEADRPLCPRCRGQLALALEIVRRPERIGSRPGTVRA